jgi:membrane protease YdiL (CAAX protease family)
MAVSLLKAIAFIAAAILLLLATGPLTAIAAATIGIGRVEMWVYGAVYSLLLLGASRLAFGLDGLTLRALGLALTRERAGELAMGFALGVTLFVGLALVRAASVGAEWSFAGVDALPGALVGLVVALVLLLPEELIFRGYAFTRLIDAVGDWRAIATSASLFGLYHLAGTEMWGMGAVFQFAMPALGGLVFGWAAVTSRGLALPIGLHLGGNWVQASVLSFAPPSSAGHGALWSVRLSDVQQQQLFAPDVGPHVPFMLTMIGATLVLRAVLDRRAPPDPSVSSNGVLN